MKMSMRIAFALAATMLVAACANMKADKAPGADLSRLHSYYVQKLSADTRGVEKLISDRLNTMGYQSTWGVVETPPQPVDAIVTYQDKWMWDITMYMLRLDIQVRDGASRNILASAQSYRPSLQRKSPDGMVEEVLNQIFENKGTP